MTKRHVAPELYLNRELGQLEFNRRVLALAEDRGIPALERLRFLCIVDWMDRNFFRRIEVCFPVIEPRLKKRVIREGLKPFLSRAAEAWEIDASGQYRHRKAERGRRGHVQTQLLEALAIRRGV